MSVESPIAAFPELDLVFQSVSNAHMQIQGIVRNGAIFFEGKIPFPEGTRVIITALSPEPPVKVAKRIEWPLVKSDQPGSLALTNERVAEIFEEEDLAPKD